MSKGRPCPLCGRIFDKFTVNGISIIVRGACPEDKEKLISFYEKLSAETIYTRFFSIIRHFEPYIDQILSSSKSLVVVAERADTGDIVGIAELLAENGQAEGGIVVLEAMQGKGIGSRLAAALKQAAVEHNIKVVYGYILPENIKAIRLVKKLGGKIKSKYPSLYYVEIPLGD